MIRRPPRSTLFPYTRSSDLGPHRRSRKGIAREVGPANGSHKESAPDLGAPGPPLEERARVLLRYAVYCRRRSEEHTSELQSRQYLVCRLLLEKKILTLTPFS